jgi:toxin ParE1/3/4
VSVPKNPNITPQAKQDLKEILKYTQKVWGSEQRVRYKTLLNQALRKITANPKLGRPREEIRAGYYSYHVGNHGRHIIFYTLDDDGILVVRVLHDSMDFETYF